jgi:hypothetical protein
MVTLHIENKNTAPNTNFHEVMLHVLELFDHEVERYRGFARF